MVRCLEHRGRFCVLRLVLAMDGFYGYTPADAAQDLINAEGIVLLKSGGVIKTITNTTYIRAK